MHDTNRHCIPNCARALVRFCTYLHDQILIHQSKGSPHDSFGGRKFRQPTHVQKTARACWAHVIRRSMWQLPLYRKKATSGNRDEKKRSKKKPPRGSETGWEISRRPQREGGTRALPNGEGITPSVEDKLREGLSDTSSDQQGKAFRGQTRNKTRQYSMLRHQRKQQAHYIPTRR